MEKKKKNNDVLIKDSIQKQMNLQWGDARITENLMKQDRLV